jgi:hypothetical protein
MILRCESGIEVEVEVEVCFGRSLELLPTRTVTDRQIEGEHRGGG